MRKTNRQILPPHSERNVLIASFSWIINSCSGAMGMGSLSFALESKPTKRNSFWTYGLAESDTTSLMRGIQLLAGFKSIGEVLRM